MKANETVLVVILPSVNEEIKPDTYGVSSRGEDKSPQIKYQRPGVAKHIARLVVACNMDWSAAVARLLQTEDEKMIERWAKELPQKATVRDALKEYFTELNISDESKKIFYAKIWEVYLDSDHPKWNVAANILRDAFGVAKAAEEGKKPSALNINGFEKGMEKMFSGVDQKELN